MAENGQSYCTTSGGSRKNERGVPNQLARSTNFFGGTPTSGHMLCAIRLGKIPFSARGSPIIDLRRARAS